MAASKNKGKSVANGAGHSDPTKASQTTSSSTTRGDATGRSLGGPGSALDPASSPGAEAATADVVKVNNASLTELKNALDDAAKAFFNREFRQVHRHEDVRISLGWLSCLVAGGVSLYGWKAGWKATKGWTYFAVSTYVVVSAVLWLYARFVEKDMVYVGTRRAVSKRVVTERLTLTSNVAPFTPRYDLSLRYTSSANSGRSLIRDDRRASSPSFGAFFDLEGVLVVEAWEVHLAGLLAEARGG